MLVQSYDNSNNNNVNLLGQYFHPRPLDFDLPLFRAANQNTQASNDNNVLKMNIIIIFISLKVLILVGLLPHKVLKDRNLGRNQKLPMYFLRDLFSRTFQRKVHKCCNFIPCVKKKRQYSAINKTLTNHVWYWLLMQTNAPF